MELRMFIAYSLWNYDFDFAPGEDGTGIERELKDHIIMRAGPLHLKFKKLR
jgi:cytochrome P450 family 628